MRRRVLIGMTVIGLGLTAYVGISLARGASFVIRAAKLEGSMRSLVAWDITSFAESDTTIPSRHGPVRARVYRPTGKPDQAVVLIHGVHKGGIGEARLVPFARHLAESGLTVLTPELVDLMQYRITGRATDTIEDVALWLSQQRTLAPRERIGLMGISFAGGLSIVAAGRPSLADRVAFVFAFGGHGDLPRVMRFLCTGRQPDGAFRDPHDYGVAVILLGVADRLVPAEQVSDLNTALTTFLQERFDEARNLAARLPEPSMSLMRKVNARDVTAIGKLLLPHIGAYGGAPQLSPERSAAPLAPIYLLHGADDTVIPAVESTLLAEWLKPRTPVHLLISPLITHVEVDRTPELSHVWRLITFWSRLLRE